MVEKSGVEKFLFALGLKSSWLKSPGLKGLGLKHWVEKSGDEMSFNQNLVFGILCIGVCGNVAYCLFFLESILLWYITEKEFNIQVKMDEIGIAQCLLFFNTTWAFGLTFLISDVGYVFHQQLTRYTGFPLDLNEKYLIVIR